MHTRSHSRPAMRALRMARLTLRPPAAAVGAHSSQTRRRAASGTDTRELACNTSISTGDTAPASPWPPPASSGSPPSRRCWKRPSLSSFSRSTCGHAAQRVCGTVQRGPAHSFGQRVAAKCGPPMRCWRAKAMPFLQGPAVRGECR